MYSFFLMVADTVLSGCSTMYSLTVNGTDITRIQWWVYGYTAASITVSTKDDLIWIHSFTSIQPRMWNCGSQLPFQYSAWCLSTVSSSSKFSTLCSSLKRDCCCSIASPLSPCPTCDVLSVSPSNCRWLCVVWVWRWWQTHSRCSSGQ